MRLARFLEGVEHFRQAVQRLGAENEIDVRGAFDERFPFLGCDTTGNADDQIGFVFSEFPEAAEIGKDFFLCLFPYGTGV